MWQPLYLTFLELDGSMSRRKYGAGILQIKKQQEGLADKKECKKADKEVVVMFRQYFA